MRQFFKMFFASLLAMIIGSVILVGLVIAIIVGIASKVNSEPETIVKSNSVLVLDLSRVIHEQGEENSFSVFDNDNPLSAGLYEIDRSIEKAADDSKIKGILIKMAPSPANWATLQSLRRSLNEFRSSGKFVYAYGEQVSQGAYYVATAADSIFVNPAGDVELKGLYTTLAFFKNTLEKLEVQPEIFYAGKFKSATEPFRADKISDANREQIIALQNGFWNEFLKAAAKHSNLDTNTINQLAVNGSIQFPQDALDNHLIDGLRYWDEVESLIRKKLALADDKKITYTAIDEYANSNALSGKSKDERIAVLFAEGQISDGSTDEPYQIASDDIAAEIRKIRDNDKVKAVVLRINSPGGSARASENILRELQLLRKKKPLIVSMGGVAASGGYYIACQADSIFALPNTVTGSIGVFSMLFNSEKMFNNKLGVKFDQVKNAPFADFPAVTRPLTVAEQQMMQRGVDTIYALFKRRVAAGRRMNEANVDSIAQGRVWTGRDALAIGLVDGLGDMERAIASAAAIAKIKDYQVITYPERVDRFKTMMKKIKNNTATSSIATQIAEQELGISLRHLRELKNLAKMNGKNMMLLPFAVSTQ